MEIKDLLLNLLSVTETFCPKLFASFPCFGLNIRVLFVLMNALFRWAVDKSNKPLATRLKSV